MSVMGVRAALESQCEFRLRLLEYCDSVVLVAESALYACMDIDASRDNKQDAMQHLWDVSAHRMMALGDYASARWELSEYDHTMVDD